MLDDLNLSGRARLAMPLYSHVEPKVVAMMRRCTVCSSSTMRKARVAGWLLPARVGLGPADAGEVSAGRGEAVYRSGEVRDERGGVVSASTYSRVWEATRGLGLTPDRVDSLLAGRPYDLRHAGVSLWLNAGVPAPDAAKRAGHSVDVLLKVYAKCLDGDGDAMNERIERALAVGGSGAMGRVAG